MGFSLKKTLKKTGIAKPLKKVASIATSTAAGFAGGGGVGTVAGLARGIIKNTKTSKAETINLRTVGQGVATGAVANVAAGAAAKGFVAFKALGTGAAGAPGTSLFSKIGAFGKSGGLAGNFGKILKGAGAVFSKGGGFMRMFGGKSPGLPTGEEPVEALDDQNTLSDGLRNAYGMIEPDLKDRLRDVTSRIRDRGIGNVARDLAERAKEDGLGSALKETSREFFVPQPTPASAPVIVEAGMGGGSNTTMLIVAAAMIGLFFMNRKK